jgi:hypothetical protein
MKGLNVKPETLKPPQDNIGKSLEDTGIVNVFLSRTPIAQRQEQGLTNWTSSNQKVSAHQEKQLLESMDNPQKNFISYSWIQN